SRSIAGGPQIRAPIARYARNNLDEAPAVAGGVDPGCARALPLPKPGSSPPATTANSAHGCVRNCGITRYDLSCSYIAAPSVGSCDLIELHPMSMRALRSTA